MTHYRTLGVSTDASPIEITEAFKKLAQRYHPDKVETGDPELYNKISLAYKTLIDAELRTEYDKTISDLKYKEAVEKLKIIIIGVIKNTEADLSLVDLVATMRNNIRVYQNGLTKDINEINDDIIKFQKAVSLLQRKTDGRNIFAESIEIKISSLKEIVVKLFAEIELSDQMLEILENYEYCSTKLLTSPASFYSPSGWSYTD